MALKDFKLSRDRGAAVRAFLFRHGENSGDYFAYTDGASPVSVTASGRARVYISIDRSAAMADRGRLAIAKSAVVYALSRIKADILGGSNYDLVVSAFADTESRIIRFSATTTGVDEIIAWVNALTVSSAAANFAVAVAHGATWFADAGVFARHRCWFMLSAGRGDAGQIADAVETVAPLVSQVGSDAVGYIPTDTYAIAIGTTDLRGLRWFDNTPHDSTPVIEENDSDAVWRRISGVRRGDITYTPAAISLGEIKAVVVPDEQGELEITIPENLGLALHYQSSTPRKPMFLTIYEGQADDPDRQFVMAWSGRVISAKRTIRSHTVTLSCEPLSSSLERNGLRRLYQYGCPHVLYGDQCGASIKAASVRFSPEVGAWDPASRVLPVPAGVLIAPTSRYVGGLVWWEQDGVTQRRTIVRVSGDNLLLSGPILNALSSAPIWPASDSEPFWPPSDSDPIWPTNDIFIALGCNHTRAFCRANHVEAETGLPNSVNYGGQDLIPTKNPFRFVSNYY